MALTHKISFRRKLIQLDNLIQWALDRILPPNLTTRYLIGLGIVAALAIFGQIFIQVSLTRQIKVQDQIRFLDNHLPVTESLRKSLLALELSSGPREMQRHAQAVKAMTTLLAFTLPSSMLPPELEISLREDQIRIIRYTDMLHAQLFEVIQHRIPHRSLITDTTEVLISTATQTGNTIKQAISFLENEHRRQIESFKNIELILTFLTLFGLVFEALYVFRPAVERLYDALRVRSDFLSRMGHEIRNPMNSIIGMTNLLADTPINDQQKRYLSILKKSSRGLLDMLNSLLDFSSLESGKIKLEKTSFQLDDLMERALDLIVAGAHANSIELILDLDPHVPLKLEGDPTRLYQILTNLLGNALKFTKKGQIVLSANLIEFDPSHSTSTIEFAITDTGIGIEFEKLATIFDAFIQEDSSVKRRFGGTGLGLTISKQLVERMGGTLKVKSEKNVGSQFSFALRLATKPHSSVADSVSVHLQQHPISAYQGLLVEQNPAISQIVENLVQLSGGNCVRLKNEESELSRWIQIPQNHLASHRLVLILDYESVKTRLETLLPWLTQWGAQTNRVLFLMKTTASAEDLERLGRVGIKNLLFKPIKPFQFFEALTTALSVPAIVSPNASNATEPSPTSPELDEPLDHARPLNILVSDDSYDNQMLISLYLQNTPYKLTFTDNGKHAIQKFKEGHFDLVLMDLQMPEVDGYSATHTIRNWERALSVPATPVIAISAHDPKHEPDRFQAAEFTGYLLKPIDALQLRRKIRELASETASVPAKTTSSNNALREIEKQIAKLVPAYLANRKREITELRHFFSQQDFKSIQTIGHRLKGNAKSYGFPELAEIGSELEIAAKDQDLEKVQVLIERTDGFLSRSKDA